AAVIVTVPIVDYVAGDEQAVCNIQNQPNYLALHFKRNQPTKGAAFSLTPDPNDGNVYQDEFVNWLKQAVPGANVLIQLDNEPDARRGAPGSGALRRDRVSGRPVRAGDQERVAERVDPRSGQLRLRRVRQPPGRAGLSGERQLPRLLPHEDGDRRVQRRQAPR